MGGNFTQEKISPEVLEKLKFMVAKEEIFKNTQKKKTEKKNLPRRRRKSELAHPIRGQII